MPGRNLFTVCIFILSLFQATIGFAQKPGNYNLKDSSLIIYSYFSSDSLNYKQGTRIFDSLPNNPHRYDPLSAPDKFFATSGNTGRSSNPLSYQPKLNLGFDYGIHTLDPYLFDVNSLPYFSVFYPMSRIKYLMGGKKELLLDILHNQNIGKRFTLGLNVRAMKSPGSYINQVSELFDVYSTLTYQSKNKRYRASGGALFNFLRNGENGGIITDSLFEKNLETNRKLIPVKLETARSLYKETAAFLTQEYEIFKIRNKEQDSTKNHLTSLLPGKIRFSANYNKQAWHYDDNGNQSYFYPFPALDTTITRDLTEIETYKTSLFLYHPLNDYFPVSYYGRLNYRTDQVKDPSGSKTEYQWLGAAGLEIPLPIGFRAGLDWEQQIYGRYSKGDQKTQVYLQQNIGKADKRFTYQFKYTFAAATPSYFLQSYHSNYFNWDNSFSKVKTTILAASATYRGYLLEIRHIEVNRPVVLMPTNAWPYQSSEKLTIQEIRFDKVFHFWYLVADNEIRYQQVSNDLLIHLPALVSRHALYFDLHLFKNALNMQPGFDINFRSANFGDAYMPAIRSFYLQYNTKLGPQATVDLFVNLKLSRAAISLSYTHLDVFWGDGKYYQTPGYPMQDPGLKFGVSWLLRDPPETKKPSGDN